MDYTVNTTALLDHPFTPLGGSPAFTAEGLEDFLREPRIALVSYLRVDGRPNTAPLWFTYRDGTLWFNVETNSAKHRALIKDSRVCVTVQDERPPYRALIVEGTMELVDNGTDSAFMFQQAVRYFGRIGANEYVKQDHAEPVPSTLLRLVPTEVKGFDNTSRIGAVLRGFARLRMHLPIPMRWL
jgi:PPOX class probable F420-dependent enzyme